MPKGRNVNPPPTAPKMQRLLDKGTLIMVVPIVLVVAVVFVPAYIWTACRIEVGPGEFVPLLKKTGKNLENAMVIAPDGTFQGPQAEILREGRHFRFPYFWSWPSRPMKATVIDDGQVGILIRKYGDPLPDGAVIATEPNQKGILKDVLKSGRHYINLWAYDVQIVDMVKIEPGHMGVVTLKVGKKSEKASFVVAEGERGVQPTLIRPGTHPQYSNKHVYRVDELDVRSHKLEMSGVNSIRFPSKYGFDILVEGTIEWAPDLEKLPELFVKFVDETDLEKSGGIDNIQQKIILPYARSFFRTIGGSYQAVDYITGSTRVVVQNKVEAKLREACAHEGILIKSVVIKSTNPPERIREQYQRREIARRTKDQYEKEIEMEVGDAGLVVGQKQLLDKDGRPVVDKEGRPVMITPDGKRVEISGRLERELLRRRKDREMQFGKVREEVAQRFREAQQYQYVEVTQAKRELEVTKIRKKAAEDKAQAVLAEGKARAAVTVMAHKAEAEAVKAKISAFGTGEKYAEYMLISKLSPGISDIMSNTDGLFAKLFERFASLEEDKDKEVKK